MKGQNSEMKEISCNRCISEERLLIEQRDRTWWVSIISLHLSQIGISIMPKRRPLSRRVKLVVVDGVDLRIVWFQAHHLGTNNRHIQFKTAWYHSMIQEHIKITSQGITQQLLQGQEVTPFILLGILVVTEDNRHQSHWVTSSNTWQELHPTAPTTKSSLTTLLTLPTNTTMVAPTDLHLASHRHIDQVHQVWCMVGIEHIIIQCKIIIIKQDVFQYFP